MGNEIGVLSRKLEKEVAHELVEILKLSGLAGLAAKVFGPMLVGVFDNQLLERIPEPYNSAIEKTLIAILEEKDYDKAITMATDFADTLIDIPGIDDPTEKLFFNGLAIIIAALLAKIGIIKTETE